MEIWQYMILSVKDDQNDWQNLDNFELNEYIYILNARAIQLGAIWGSRDH